MLKTLGGYIKEFKLATILTPVFMLVEVIMETIIPKLMGSIVDDGIDGGNMGHIYLMGGLMVLAALISLAGGCLGAYFGAKAAMGAAGDV